MTTFINYAVHGGYDPNDGLDESAGRWMYDDERMCMVWVQIVQSPAIKINQCECGVTINKGSTRCQSCNMARLQAARPTHPHHVTTCPKCGAKPGKTCRTKNGNPASAHQARLQALEVSDAA